MMFPMSSERKEKEKEKEKEPVSVEDMSVEPVSDQKQLKSKNDRRQTSPEVNISNVIRKLHGSRRINEKLH